MSKTRKKQLDISTEEKIKNAALKLFTRKGYAATRTRDISEEAGINLALLLHFHPFVGVVLAFGIVPKWNTMGDLAGNIVDLEIVDTLGATLAGKDVGPSGFNTTTQRRD